MIRIHNVALPPTTRVVRALRARPATTVLGVLALLILAVTPATAEIAGGCRASINGTDVAGVNSTDPAQAIKVEQGGQASVVLEAASPISQLYIYLDFAGIKIPAVQRPVSGASVRETVPVDQYAKYGVGLYRVIGEGSGSGQTCAGSALINVAGNPLETTAGMAGAAATGAGVLGVAGASAAAALRGPRSLRVSGLGLLTGLIAGVGGLILAQQYGIAYPSAPVALGSLGGGLLGGGVILPSLFGLLRPA